MWYGEVSRKCLLVMYDESKNVQELPGLSSCVVQSIFKVMVDDVIFLF